MRGLVCDGWSVGSVGVVGWVVGWCVGGDADGWACAGGWRGSGRGGWRVVFVDWSARV